MKKLIAFFLLCSVALGADRPYRILNSFNAGELSTLLSAREDLSKYHSGCSLMENMLPLPQGGAEKRPGTKYVAESKENTKIRLLPFEYSTEQSYIIELGNQYARFCTNNAQISGGSGTESLGALDNIKGHWLLNDDVANTAVLDADGSTHDFVASTNTENIHKTGKVGTGSFDLDAQYNAYGSDHADFTFIEGADGDFSVAAWAYIQDVGTEQIIISKWDETTGSEEREWKLFLDENLKLELALYDDSFDISGDRIAHWKMNDNAATAVVLDAVAVVPHNGALDDGNGDDTSDHSVTGKINNALSLDGTDDKITVGDNAALTFVTVDTVSDSAFSISAWINMDDATEFPIFGKNETGGAAEEYLFWVDASDKLGLYLFDGASNVYEGAYYNTAITAQEGSWAHVVATYDATEASTGITLYVNGSAVANTIDDNGAYTAMHNGTGEVYIGYTQAIPGSEALKYADGKIDNVILFNKELSADEVTNLYNSGSGYEGWEGLTVHSTSDDAVDVGWRFIAATYEGENGAWTGATAANYITLYVDGSAVDVTATNRSTYTKMEDTAALPRIGAQESAAGAIEKIWAYRIDEISVFNDELSSTEVSGLYTSAAYEVTSPYLTADLFELKYEQSADVLYITHPDYETLKLSRYNDTDWRFDVLDAQTGPFRTQNTDESATISFSATTGSVTLTASGCAPFVSGTTTGHLPGGVLDTSKSQTGALFKFVHPLDELEYHTDLEDNYTDDQTEDVSWIDCGTLYKGATWTLVTDGTWEGTLEVQKNYAIGAAHDADGWEVELEFSSSDDRNVSTTGTEDSADADYRCILTATQGASEDCEIYFSTDQTEHVGIVEITAVASPISATGTVVETLASTAATHKWSEGAWSNYRGWPQTATFYEDRLCFGGNTSQPDTIWGSVTSAYEDFTEGAEDDDAVNFTLSSRQVNVIQWIVGKDKILIGTSGAEWTLGGSSDEPLTPSNVKAEQHSAFGSANLQANLASESVLFFQRGAEKMRELAYNWEMDSYVSPDMTVLAPEIIDGGIDDTDYQQTPNPILWCVRDANEICVFVYERKELITSWARLITDGDFESVAIISGTTESEIWVSVERVIDGSTVRYIEYFTPRDWDSDSDAFFVDCGITDTGGDATITGLSHLEGETVHILGDGVVIASETVSSGQITADSVCSKYQVGLPYTVQLKTMPLSWIMQGGQTIQGRIKRINEVIPRWYESGDFYIGKDYDNKELMSISGITTSEERKTFQPGYDRSGYIYFYQQSAEPLTLLALMIEFMVY